MAKFRYLLIGVNPDMFLATGERLDHEGWEILSANIQDQKKRILTGNQYDQVVTILARAPFDLPQTPLEKIIFGLIKGAKNADKN